MKLFLLTLSYYVGYACDTPPEAPPHTRLMSDISSSHTYTFGEQVTYTAPKGMFLETSYPGNYVNSITFICRDDGMDGTWDLPAVWPVAYSGTERYRMQCYKINGMFSF